MVNLDTIAADNAANIKKFTRAVVFFAPITATVPVTLTEVVSAAPPTLLALPVDYVSGGLIKKDGGFEFSSDREIADVESLGYTSPTRKDVQSEDISVTFSLQEFKRVSFEKYLGADLSTATVDATTGEVSFARPITPELIEFRAFIIARDRSGPNATYYGRFYPRAVISEVDTQSFSPEDEYAFPLTMAAYPDATLGYAEKLFIGGPGFKTLGTAGHGFPAA